MPTQPRGTASFPAEQLSPIRASTAKQRGGTIVNFKFVSGRGLGLLLSIQLVSIAGAQHASEESLKAPVFTTEALAAPHFTFRDLNGRQHRLQEKRGTIVVLNFWGTWCPGCVSEMPTLQALYNRFQTDPKVTFIAVSSIDTIDKVQAFRDRGKFTLPMYMTGSDTLPKGFDSGAWPATYIISSDGVIRAEFLGGANWSDESVVNFIKSLEKR